MYGHKYKYYINLCKCIFLLTDSLFGLSQCFILVKHLKNDKLQMILICQVTRNRIQWYSFGEWSIYRYNDNWTMHQHVFNNGRFHLYSGWYEVVPFETSRVGNSVSSSAVSYRLCTTDSNWFKIPDTLNCTALNHDQHNKCMISALCYVCDPSGYMFLMS